MSGDELPGGYTGGADGQEGTSASPQDACVPVANTPAALAGSRQGSQERLSRRGSNSQRFQRGMSSASAGAAAVEAGSGQKTTRSGEREHSRRQRKHAPAAEEASSDVAPVVGEDGRKKGTAGASPARASGHQLSRDAIPTGDVPTLWGHQQQQDEEQQYKSDQRPQHQQQQHREQYEQQPQQWHNQQRRQQPQQPQQYLPQYQQQFSAQPQQETLPRVRRWPSSEWKNSKNETQKNDLDGSPANDDPPIAAPPPFVQILQQQHHQKPSPAHTTEAEILPVEELVCCSLLSQIHFIGELEAGQGFCSSGGLFCEFSFEAGNYWLSLCRAAEKTHQTQTAYGSVGDLYVWNHPIDLHYALSSVVGWPRCRLSIWKLNSFGKVENVSYGTITLPTTAGHHEFTCQTWTPLGTYSEEFAGRFLGRRTELDSLDVLDSRIGDRMKLTTRSSGQVLFVLDVIQRNFEYHGLSSCSQYPAANIGSNICLAFTRPEPPLSFHTGNSKTGATSANEQQQQQQKPEFRTLGTNSSYSKLSESGYVLDAPNGTDQLFGAPRRGLSGAMCPVSPRGKVSSNKKKE